MNKKDCGVILWVLPGSRHSEEAEQLLREKGIPFKRKEMDYQKWPPGTAFRCPALYLLGYPYSGLKTIKKVAEEISCIYDQMSKATKAKQG